MTDALSHHTPEALAKAWCYLNVHERPPGFPASILDEYTVQQLKRLIVERVGREACLAAWNEYEFWKGSGRKAK